MKKEPEFPKYPPLFFVRITGRFRNFLLRLNRRFTHPNVVLLEMIQNFWLAAGINVAAELGIADLLQTGPLSMNELAERTGTHQESLYRILRMLASQGIFRELEGGRFATTPLAKPLQEDQMRHFLLVHLTPRHFEMFGDLVACVKTGKNVSGEPSGQALFDHIGNNEQKNDRFNRAMTNASWMQASAIILAFSFKRFRNIIDIGGGQGLLLAAVLRHWPSSKGIVFDLPNALAHAGKIIEDFSLGERMIAEGGDFFKKVPEGGDLYMVKSVLHDWNDEDSMRILRNIHRAMGPDSRLLVIESVIPEGNQPSFGKMTDILMMVAAGGKERTGNEYKELLERAGFRIIKIRPTVTPFSLIEAMKI